jgi:hypothetical protein
MAAGLVDPFAMPGMGTPSESTENEFLWGNRETAHYESGVIVSTTTDAGSSPTTTLRPGLLMGKVTASGKWGKYDPTATDGREVAQGILRFGVNMLDTGGTAADKAGVFVIKGFAKNGSVYNLDALARRQLFGRFLFDDDFAGLVPHFKRVVAKTADYTVLAADNDTIFTNQGASGAVIFTLPTLARGLHFTFFSEAAQNITVTSAAVDTIVTHNDLAADSVALATASRQIGGSIEVFANADATKWLTRPGTWNIADDGTTTTKFTIAT